MIRNPSLAIGFAAALALSVSAVQAQTAQPNAIGQAAQDKTAPHKTASQADQKFVTNAIEGNYAEIAVGKLAQQKGTTEAVRNFGQTLVTDHSANNDKAKQVASELGVTPPSGSSVMEKGTYLKLKVLSGKSFDRAFASAMVKDHKADIKVFQKEAAKSDAAGEFAKQTLPTLQKHLQLAQSITPPATTGSR